MWLGKRCSLSKRTLYQCNPRPSCLIVSLLFRTLRHQFIARSWGLLLFVPQISEDNMKEAQAGDTPDSYRSAPHHQPPMTPGMHSSARYATDADHKRAVASPSRPVSTIADANGTTPEMKTTAASSWHTQKLGWRVGVDCTAAASAGMLVAPVVTAIDRYVQIRGRNQATLVRVRHSNPCPPTTMTLTKHPKTTNPPPIELSSKMPPAAPPSATPFSLLSKPCFYGRTPTFSPVPSPSSLPSIPEPT